MRVSEIHVKRIRVNKGLGVNSTQIDTNVSFLFQVQKYAETNGGKNLNLDEWNNLYNISSNVGNGLLESGVVKMMLG